MSIYLQSALHIAYVEQAARRDAALDTARARIRHLETRLAIAERVALRLADRDARSRAWAERLEREAFLAVVPAPREPEATEQEQAIASWQQRRAQ